jgi:hypothetical protein
MYILLSSLFLLIDIAASATVLNSGSVIGQIAESRLLKKRQRTLMPNVFHVDRTSASAPAGFNE